MLPYLLINSIICFMATLFITVSAVCAQTDVTVAGDLSPFLLDKSDMSGFILKWQGKSFIQTSPTTYIRSIRQIWYKSGGDSLKDNININCGLFSSIPEALKSMKYRAGSYSGPYIWTSPDGNIIGDNSFYFSDNNSLSVILIRGNIGVQVLQTGVGNWVQLKEVVDKVLDKIEENLSSEILASEENARAGKISEGTFQNIIQSAMSIPEASVFSAAGGEWESKWPQDDTHFVMGRRMEWGNEGGDIFGIDICECTSDIDAEKALENRKQFGYTFRMGDISEIDSLISYVNVYAIHKDILSLVSSSGKAAVHFYMISPHQELKREIFASMVKKAVERISFSMTSVDDLEGGFTKAPSVFTLSQNTPNPFNPSTVIAFTLLRPERVNLTVYDALGREVALLASGNFSAGSHTMRWDGRDGRGNAVSSGVYLYRLEAGGRTETRKMLLVR